MKHEWYCLAFGIELGPMSWDDLKIRAARGDIASATQIRQGVAGPWLEARHVAGLLSPGAPSDAAQPCDTDFELAPRIAADAPETVDFSSTSPLVAPDDSLPRLVATGLAPREREPATAERRPSELQSPRPAPSAVSPGAKPPAAAKRAPTATAGPKPGNLPRVSFELHVPARVWQGAAAVLVLAAVAALGSWLGTRKSHDPSDYVRIANGLQQVFDELHQFREAPRGDRRPNIGMQLMPRVASLRKQLRDSPPAAAVGTLSEAGTRLAELLAGVSIAPGSPPAAKYRETEQQFVALLDKAKHELAN